MSTESEGKTGTEVEAEVVEFVDAPGDIPFGSLFGGDTNSEPAKNEQAHDYGFGAETPAADEAGKKDDEEEAGGEGGAAATTPTIDPQIEQRFAVMEATNASLRSTIQNMTAAQQVQTVDKLMTEYEEAVALGDDTKVTALRDQIKEAKAATTAPAASAPEVVVSPSGNTPAPGHWSHNIRTEAKAWANSQPWFGVDPVKTKAANELGTVLDFTKFPTKEAYFKAVTDNLDGTTQSSRPAPQGGKEPRGSTTSKAASKDITSLKQLPPHVQDAAAAAMRNGLSEKAYLKSYNEVAKTQAARRAK